MLIGQPKALAYAIRNLTVINRNTKLKERLRGEIEANNDSGLHISSRYILPEEQPMMAANQSQIKTLEAISNDHIYSKKNVFFLIW